jgi:putative tryptophan/tyrosine transport system substrate-binding protein
MRRRDFITLLGSAAAAWPLMARAQQSERTRRVGVLVNSVATDADRESDLDAFSQGLRQLGWIEGQNLHIETRYNAGSAELAQIYAAQLIGLMPDVILALSSTNLTVIRQATNKVPVVFMLITDPVAQGFVPSLMHPGGNLTGFSNGEFSVGGKWLDLLKQAAPSLARILVMFNPDTSPQSQFYMRAIAAAAASLGVQANAAPVYATADIEPVLEAFASQPGGGLILPTGSFQTLRYKLIADLAMRLKLPSIASTDFFRAGGLMSYNADSTTNGQFRQAAIYVDRILKGEKPGDLPVQQAAKYSLGINLKTARALGLTIPLTLLSLAEETIE